MMHVRPGLLSIQNTYTKNYTIRCPLKMVIKNEFTPSHALQTAKLFPFKRVVNVKNKIKTRLGETGYLREIKRE